MHIYKYNIYIDVVNCNNRPSNNSNKVLRYNKADNPILQMSCQWKCRVNLTWISISVESSILPFMMRFYHGINYIMCQHMNSPQNIQISACHANFTLPVLVFAFWDINAICTICPVSFIKPQIAINQSFSNLHMTLNNRFWRVYCHNDFLEAL